jgi:cleavage stimulation factor subunit 3
MFIRAKKAPNCPWQVYVASALMEWHHEGGRDVARKIFEKGLEQPEFLVTAQYILQYVDFLLGEIQLGWLFNAHVCFDNQATQHDNIDQG